MILAPVLFFIFSIMYANVMMVPLHLPGYESWPDYHDQNQKDETLLVTFQDDTVFRSNYYEAAKTPRYFIAFSTSCSTFQNWQSTLFFYHAMKMKQPGNVTRLVSDCTEEQKLELAEEFNTIIRPMSESFSLYITPDYDGHDGYKKYWNKPFGFFDWMKNVLAYPENKAKYSNAIIILTDPDMLLLNSITHKFESSPEDWFIPVRTNQVLHGLPVASYYGFRDSWLTSLNGNLSKIVGHDSPALNLTSDEVLNYYPAGPPYIAFGKDMYELAKHWVKFLPKYWEFHNGWYSEMFAYCVAAAHLNLPHQLAKGIMVSVASPSAGESLQMLNNVTRRDACMAGVTSFPLALHYCQEYGIGRWFFSKYKMRNENLFDCNTPLLKEPPSNVGELYDWKADRDGQFQNYTGKNDEIILNTWFLCKMIYGLNEAASYVKERHCRGTGNFNKTMMFPQ